MIFRCDEQELVEKGVISQSELDWFNNNRAISYFADGSVWKKKGLIEAKVEEAIEKEIVKPEPEINETFETTAGFYVVSDDISPIVSQADGKTYDSKSQYYKSVKEAGLVIVGNDYQQMLKPKTPYKSSNSELNETKQAVKNAIEEVRGRL